MAKKDSNQSQESQPGIIASVGNAIDKVLHPEAEKATEQENQADKEKAQSVSVEKQKPVSGPGGDYYLGKTSK